MKTLSKLSVLLLIICFLTSCENNDNTTTNTIVDVAVKNNLSSLVAAVQRADLAGTLSSEGSFTVLAPTNKAFEDFLADNNFDTLEDVPVPLLRQILLNHVITGSLRSTDLSTGYFNTNATSEASGTAMSIYINTENGVMFNGISTVATANVEADNGIVHVVDKVIGLPTVVTFATADPNFSILVQALTRETSFTYVNTLSTANGTNPAPFTVFAPNNSAFVSLLSELQVSSLSDIPTAALASTLNTHVVAGANVLDTGISNDMPITTLGGELTANVGNTVTLTDPRNRVSTVIATNVQANNGVIHVINKVLLDQ